MGGERGGERASEITAQYVAQLSSCELRTRNQILTALEQAQHDVRALGETLGGVAGTTVSGVVLHQRPTGKHNAKHAVQEYRQINAIDHISAMLNLETRAMLSEQDWDSTQVSDHGEYDQDQYCYIINVGDSRTYHMQKTVDQTHWDAASLCQITHDHSRRQEAIDNGMPEEQANTVIPRNIITQCIGAPEGIAPDFYVARASGRFIICSDGLHSIVDDDTIASIAAQQETAKQAAQALLQCALDAGGNDNVTIIVADMPANAYQWSFARLGFGEDIGQIRDETLDTRRTSKGGR